MMPPLSPPMLIAAANAFVGLGEEGGDNRGQMVELFLREVGQPAGQPWCAAFVFHVGYWSHYDFRVRQSSWPLPPTASCWQLGHFARRHGLFVDQAQMGDVFLKYSPELRRFVHTGVVVEVDENVDSDDISICTTIEGNTNDDGSPNGFTTLRKVRTFSAKRGDGFIRWADIALRAAA